MNSNENYSDAQKSGWMFYLVHAAKTSAILRSWIPVHSRGISDHDHPNFFIRSNSIRKPKMAIQCYTAVPYNLPNPVFCSSMQINLPIGRRSRKLKKGWVLRLRSLPQRACRWVSLEGYLFHLYPLYGIPLMMRGRPYCTGQKSSMFWKWHICIWMNYDDHIATAQRKWWELLPLGEYMFFRCVDYLGRIQGPKHQSSRFSIFLDYPEKSQQVDFEVRNLCQQHFYVATNG